MINDILINKLHLNILITLHINGIENNKIVFNKSNFSKYFGEDINIDDTVKYLKELQKEKNILFSVNKDIWNIAVLDNKAITSKLKVIIRKLNNSTDEGEKYTQFLTKQIEDMLIRMYGIK